MKLLIAIFLRELRRISRVKYFHLRRVVVLVGIGAAFMIAAYDALKRTSTGGLEIFESIAWIVFITMLYIAPVSSSNVISEEKERGTLGLLLLTDFSCSGIIYSKFIFRFFTLVLSSLATLPIFLFCVSMGGISPEQIVVVFLIFLSTLLLGTAIGLTASTITSAKNSQGLALGMMIFFCIITAIAQELPKMRIEWFTFTPPQWWFFSPIVALEYALRGTHPSWDINCYWAVGWTMLATAVLLVFSVKMLPIVQNKLGHTPANVRMKRSFKDLWHTLFKVRTGSIGAPLYGNPIVWRDYHKYFGGRSGRWAKVVLGIGLLMFFAYVGHRRSGFQSLLILGYILCLVGTAVPKKHKLYIFMSAIALVILGTINIEKDRQLMVSSMFFFTMSIAMGVTLWSGSLRTFAREKEQKAYDVLLMSGLSSTEILQGKIGGLLKSIVPYVAGIIASGFVMLTHIVPKGDDLGYMFVYTFYVVGYVFVISAGGIYCSFKKDSVRKAANYMMLIYIIWTMANNFMFLTMMRSVRASSETFAGFHFLYGVFYIIVGMSFITYVERNIRPGEFGTN